MAQFTKDFEQVTRQELDQLLAAIDGLAGDEQLAAQLDLATRVYGAGSVEAAQVGDRLALSRLAQFREEHGRDPRPEEVQ